MASTLPRTISVDGTTLTLSVQRKHMKNVNARLRGSTLYVSAPLSMPHGELEAAYLKLARRLLRQIHARRANAEDDALTLATKVARRFPEPPNVEAVTFVSNQRSRWGSYSQRTHTIRLNAALRSMPRWVLEAVVAHELTHAIHPDHSPVFWELLRGVCPDTDRAHSFLAGVSWLGANWQSLPGIELQLLTEASGDQIK